jgi:hypothetical protein
VVRRQLSATAFAVLFSPGPGRSHRGAVAAHGQAVRLMDTCLVGVAGRVGGVISWSHRLRKEPGMLWMLQVSERRYRAVQEVLDGASVTAVARPCLASVDT